MVDFLLGSCYKKGARGGTRTHKPVQAAVFKTAVSASFTTRAPGCHPLSGAGSGKATGPSNRGQLCPFFFGPSRETLPINHRIPILPSVAGSFPNTTVRVWFPSRPSLHNLDLLPLQQPVRNRRSASTHEFVTHRRIMRLDGLHDSRYSKLSLNPQHEFPNSPPASILSALPALRANEGALWRCGTSGLCHDGICTTGTLQFIEQEKILGPFFNLCLCLCQSCPNHPTQLPHS